VTKTSHQLIFRAALSVTHVIHYIS